MCRTLLWTQVLLLEPQGSGERVRLGLCGPPPTTGPVSLARLESSSTDGVVMAGTLVQRLFPMIEEGSVWVNVSARERNLSNVGGVPVTRALLAGPGDPQVLWDE